MTGWHTQWVSCTRLPACLPARRHGRPRSPPASCPCTLSATIQPPTALNSASLPQCHPPPLCPPPRASSLTVWVRQRVGLAVPLPLLKQPDLGQPAQPLRPLCVNGGFVVCLVCCLIGLLFDWWDFGQPGQPLCSHAAKNRQPSPAQPSPAQPSPAQPSPAQPSPAPHMKVFSTCVELEPCRLQLLPPLRRQLAPRLVAALLDRPATELSIVSIPSI